MPNITIKCVHCGKDFDVIPSKSSQKYCSRECFTAARRKKIERVCPHCGITFVNLMNRTKYCSRDCARAAQSEIMRAGGQQAAEKVRKMREAVRMNGIPDQEPTFHPDVLCPVCHKLMPYYRKTCSSDCAHELRRLSRLAACTDRVCPTCGKTFSATGKRVYCSAYCLKHKNKS